MVTSVPPYETFSLIKNRQNIIMQKLLRRIVSKIRYSKQTKEEKEKRKTEIEHIVKHLKPSLKHSPNIPTWNKAEIIIF
jgi:hypothetical protein